VSATAGVFPDLDNMAKHCETFDHTADVGLSASADTPGELFEALAEGLADVICPRGQVSPREIREVRVEADDIEALAVDFLWQVMSVIQFDRRAVASVRVVEITDTSVVAELSCEPLDLSRHEIAAEVKAVTYHQLKIAPETPGWVGRVILDL